MAVISTQKVTNLPAGLEVQAGNISGLTGTGRPGSNTAVGTSFEQLNELGGTRNELYTDPSTEGTGQQIKVKSASTDDTNSGSGHARRVKVIGTGPLGVELEENINLNGTAQVTSSGFFTSVSGVSVNKIGSGGTVNAGNITVFANDGSTALLQMDAGDANASFAGIYGMSGKKIYISQLFATAIESAEVAVFQRNAGKGFVKKQTLFLNNNAFNYVSEVPLVIENGDCVEVRAKRLGSTDAKVNADLQVFIETV